MLDSVVYCRPAERQLPEHCELLGGELVEKSIPSFEHGRIQRRLGVFLDPFDGLPRSGAGAPDSGPGGWWLATECEIVLTEQDRFLPDLAGWQNNRVPEMPHGRPITRTPQWVCEILSPSTAERDRGPKRDVYHRAGVFHYWIIDPVSEPGSGSLTVLERGSDAYRSVAFARWSASEGTPTERCVRVKPFHQIELDLAWLFDHLPLHAGQK
ncbi:MAG: Uma2 family endonuclease [Myxococcota bacterium]